MSAPTITFSSDEFLLDSSLLVWSETWKWISGVLDEFIKVCSGIEEEFLSYFTFSSYIWMVSFFCSSELEVYV